MTATAATESCLEAIEKHNGTLNAFITVMADQARADAAKIDAAHDRGEWGGLLAGVPISVKDCIDVAGVPCTNGTLFYKDYVPNSDAPIVGALKRAGAVIVGKTNLHEFCYGATSQNPHYGRVRNPWDTDRIPSGSSGGAGAALASGMCVAAVGSDTGGSVRVPAAVNGVCALRPTLGAIPMSGSKTQLCPAIDTVGPMARTVADVARIFAVMAFYDDEDPTSIPHAWENYLATLGDGIDGVRIGVPENYFFDDLAAGVDEAVRATVDQLVSLGARLVPVRLEGAETIQKRVMPMVWADLFQFHKERVETQSDMYGDDVLGRILLGKDISGADYAEALRHREHWNRIMDRTLRDVDVILTPTSPVPAPRIDESDDMVATTHRLTSFTFPFSWSGVPGLSIPCGFTPAGLPVGVQVHGRKWEEGLLLRIGSAYQQATDWHQRTPPIFGS